MEESLYKKSDGVYILTDKNFRNGRLISGYIKPGILKAYAVWCSHCQNKVEDFKVLARSLKQEKVDLCVYVIEASQNEEFSRMMKLEGFPTIYYVDREGVVSKLLNKKGEAPVAVKDIIECLSE